MNSRYLHPDVDDIYSQLDSAMEQPTYDGVIFESDKPVLESELNEMQAISNANIKNISAICAGECALVLAPNATFIAETTSSKYNYVRVLIENGFILHRGHLIRLTNSTTNKNRYDKTISDAVATVEYISIDFDDEPLTDDRIGIETTKRRKYKITLGNTENDTNIAFYKMEDNKFAFMLPIIDLRSKNNVILHPHEYRQVGCKIPHMIGNNLIGDFGDSTKVYMGEYNEYDKDDLFEFGVGTPTERRNIISWTDNSLKIDIKGKNASVSRLMIHDSTRQTGDIEISVESEDGSYKMIDIKCRSLSVYSEDFATLCDITQLGKDTDSITNVYGTLRVIDSNGDVTNFSELKKSVSDGKTALASAITDMTGKSVNSDATFATMVNAIRYSPINVNISKNMIDVLRSKSLGLYAYNNYGNSNIFIFKQDKRSFSSVGMGAGNLNYDVTNYAVNANHSFDILFNVSKPECDKTILLVTGWVEGSTVNGQKVFDRCTECYIRTSSASEDTFYFPSLKVQMYTSGQRYIKVTPLNNLWCMHSFAMIVDK